MRADLVASELRAAGARSLGACASEPPMVSLQRPLFCCSRRVGRGEKEEERGRVASNGQLWCGVGGSCARARGR